MLVKLMVARAPWLPLALVPLLLLLLYVPLVSFAAPSTAGATVPVMASMPADVKLPALPFVTAEWCHCAGR